VVAVFLLGAAACDATTGGSEVVEGDWELVTGEVDGEPFAAPAGSRITLRASGGEVSGTSACNEYDGSLRALGRIDIGQLGGTDMACEPEVMEAERRYLDALERITAAERREDGTLQLTGDGAQLHFEPVAAVEGRG
jgi:heat shock protein HslJ